MLKSKLPHVGATIFTVMSNRAQELGAVNLAQGFPDYDPPERLRALLAEHVERGRNQYAPMIGVAELREAIARQLKGDYGRDVDPQREITVTLGATEGLFSAILALVHRDDEVILFDPSYDSYAPAVLLAGGRPVHIPLEPPRFRIDWDRVRAVLSPRTRLVILNTPHNPATSIATALDLEALAELLRPTEAMVLADEVYEHMVFDGARHASILGHAELNDRGVAVFSFGKTLHATGWRVGYTVAPAPITEEIRRVHQFNTFSIAAPLQYAIADFLREAPGHNTGLAAFYQSKRDLFLERLRGSRFRWTPAEGAYFQLLDYSELSDEDDVTFADLVLHKAGVASIPVSVFYAQPPRLRLLRFCFAKQDRTLEDAAERLRALG
ncbi:MAG TPA: methionine aminotransferase [Steroidobacter sp.]|nr:methionine aminotransferase [Steroidobacter sp.]